MSSRSQTISLDAMGGDYGPPVVVSAAARALKDSPHKLSFLIFGDQEKITAELEKHPSLKDVTEIVHTSEVITNDEKPAAAIRRKDTSMRQAILAVKDGRAQSVVSAGNTGALMASAKMILKCLPGISRPAIASVFPTRKKDTVMLDLGANIHCDAPILVQFALLGAVYARVVKGFERPTIGLLNIGSEEMKGPDQLREASALLSELDFPGEFTGFVEGNDITDGTVNVVVTDGFTGNVALKVAEGVGALTGSFLKEAFMSSLLAKIGGFLAQGALRRLKDRVDPRFYNGGMFLGLNGICVKSHGGMDVYGFSRAILVAADLVEQGYNEQLAEELSNLVEQNNILSQPELAEART
jgi:glycerol-3-phosphate acyltransferase PlsX